MKGLVTHRPGSNGRMREFAVGYERGNPIFENARWRSEDGLVHQASKHHNRTLCEMGSNAFVETLHEKIIEFTYDRVTCVQCMGYVTWHQYPST